MSGKRISGFVMVFSEETGAPRTHADLAAFRDALSETAGRYGFDISTWGPLGGLQATEGAMLVTIEGERGDRGDGVSSDEPLAERGEPSTLTDDFVTACRSTDPTGGLSPMVRLCALTGPPIGVDPQDKRVVDLVFAAHHKWGVELHADWSGLHLRGVRRKRSRSGLARGGVMNVRSYTTTDGTTIDLAGLDAPDQLTWLAADALHAASWAAFRDASAWRVAQHARERAGPQWQAHPLYRLHLDMLGQIAVLTDDADGSTSASFAGLVLGAYVAVHNARRGAILHLVHGADEAGKAFDSTRSELHLFTLKLERLGLAPYPYPFDIAPPWRVFSGLLQSDVDGLEAAGLVEIANPIRATEAGSELVAHTAARCPTLRRAVRHLLEAVSTPTIEEVFGEELEEYWRIAL